MRTRKVCAGGSVYPSSSRAKVRFGASHSSFGFTWEAVAEYWHKSAFSSFGDGHGVWETGGGPLLPFSARNIKNVQQWVSPMTLEQVVPTILEMEKVSFAGAPPVKPQERRLAPVADKVQAYGVDVSAAAPNGKGLVWVAVRDGEPIAKAEIYGVAE